jgi:hypothetical protein
MKKILLLVSLFFLIGCADVTTDQIAELKVGMKLNKLNCLMGEPDNIDFSNNENTYKYLYRSGSSNTLQWLYVKVSVKDSTVKSWY